MSDNADLPELPGINTAIGMKYLMHKATLYERVLRDFHARFHTHTNAIASAIASGDLDQARRLAHSIKGLSATIGAEALQHAALQLEYVLGEGRPALVALADFDRALQVVIMGIAKAYRIESTAN